MVLLILLCKLHPEPKVVCQNIFFLYYLNYNVNENILILF